jgi:membrane protein YdbS with pleckstrin-like domain
MIGAERWRSMSKSDLALMKLILVRPGSLWFDGCSGRRGLVSVIRVGLAGRRDAISKQIGRLEVGYIEKTLGREEKILGKAHFHWLWYLEAWIAATVVFLLGFFVNLLIEHEHKLAGAAAALALGVLVLLIKLVPLWTTEIGVTDHRLIVKRGWLQRTTNELQLKAIEEVSLVQGLTGRIFNYGRIEVSGTGDDEVAIPPVGDPLQLLRTLQDATAHAQKATRLTK